MIVKIVVFLVMLSGCLLISGYLGAHYQGMYAIAFMWGKTAFSWGMLVGLGGVLFSGYTASRI